MDIRFILIEPITRTSRPARKLSQTDLPVIALVPCPSPKTGPVTISHTAKLVCDFEVSNEGGSMYGVNVPEAASVRNRYGFKDDSKVYCLVIFHISKLPNAHKLKVTNVRSGWGSVAIEVRFADISNWISKRSFDTSKTTKPERVLEETREDTYTDQKTTPLDKNLSERVANTRATTEDSLNYVACQEPRTDSVEAVEFLV